MIVGGAATAPLPSHARSSVKSRASEARSAKPVDRRSCSVSLLARHCAFEAALALGSKVKKLAIYEAPYNDDDTARHHGWSTEAAR